MNKERLAVANRISRQLDSLENTNGAMKLISGARAENVSISFSIFCQTEQGQISVTSSSLNEFNLDLSYLTSTIISELKSQVESKFGDLNSAFENDQFDVEKG